MPVTILYSLNSLFKQLGKDWFRSSGLCCRCNGTCCRWSSTWPVIEVFVVISVWKIFSNVLGYTGQQKYKKNAYLTGYLSSTNGTQKSNLCHGTELVRASWTETMLARLELPPGPFHFLQANCAITDIDWCFSLVFCSWCHNFAK